MTAFSKPQRSRILFNYFAVLSLLVFLLLLNTQNVEAKAKSSKGVVKRQGKARLPSAFTHSPSRKLVKRLVDVEISEDPVPDTEADLPSVDDLSTDEAAVDDSLPGYLPPGEIDLDPYNPDQQELQNAEVITANGGIADTDSVAAVDENGYASPISQQDLDAAINYKQGLCGTRLAKRQCDPTVATNAEVAWLARQLQGGGSVQDSIAVWIGHLRAVGRTSLPVDTTVISRILTSKLGVEVADLDDPTEIEEINETMETALSGSGTEAQAAADIVTKITEYSGGDNAIPEGEQPVNSETVARINREAFRSDPQNQGIFRRVYSFFRLVRKLSQAKAFTVTVDGRAALTDFFQTNYAVVKGGAQDVVNSLETQLRDLQSKQGGNILSHFKAAWRIETALNDAYADGKGFEADTTALNTLTSGIDKALTTRSVGLSQYLDISYGQELSAWQKFLEPLVAKSQTAESAKDMHLSDSARTAISNLLENSYGIGEDARNLAIQAIDKILDSSYAAENPIQLETYIRDNIIYRLDPVWTGPIPPAAEGAMARSDLIKALTDITSSTTSTTELVQFFTKNVGKTLLTTEDIESSVLSFTNDGRPFSDANPPAAGTHPLTRPGLRALAQRLVQLQDLVNKATEGKRVAAIRDASIKAKDALAIASTKYTPGYTSPLDIADLSNTILSSREMALKAKPASNWDYNDVEAQTAKEIQDVTKFFTNLIDGSARGLALDPTHPESIECAKAFSNFLGSRYDIVDKAADVMRAQFLKAGYGSTAVARIKYMMEAASPYMELKLIDYYKINITPEFRDELLDYQRQALKNIPKGN